jgi:hypothetical protein
MHGDVRMRESFRCMRWYEVDEGGSPSICALNEWAEGVEIGLRHPVAPIRHIGVGCRERYDWVSRVPARNLAETRIAWVIHWSCGTGDDFATIPLGSSAGFPSHQEVNAASFPSASNEPITNVIPGSGDIPHTPLFSCVPEEFPEARSVCDRYIYPNACRHEGSRSLHFDTPHKR